MASTEKLQLPPSFRKMMEHKLQMDATFLDGVDWTMPEEAAEVQWRDGWERGEDLFLA